MSFLPYGILGWTGLVGQTLFHQLLSSGIKPADIGIFNSKNLQEIRGAAFGTLYICCMPATKWRVNLHPEEDLHTLNTVMKVLETVQAHTVILLSTVDVLEPHAKEGECSELWSQHAYGQHRRTLEVMVHRQWSSALVIRLPALFGRGLKKNALYDLLHENQVANICLSSRFQWYNLARLLKDCNSYTRLRIRIAHLVSPPISMEEIATRWFPNALNSSTSTNSVVYTIYTGHGGTPDGAYTTTKELILEDMGAWISWEQHRMQNPIAASNIGFVMSEDVAKVLHHTGISHLEIAPTRGTEWADFQPLSAQSLLYGTQITNIFQTPTNSY